jgi:hypothetical protein
MSIWDISAEQHFAFSEKWAPILCALTPDEMTLLISAIARHYVVLPMWADRTQLQEMVKCPISVDECIEFRRFTWDFGGDSGIACITEIWNAWKESEQRDEWLAANAECEDTEE